MTLKFLACLLMVFTTATFAQRGDRGGGGVISGGGDSYAAEFVKTAYDFHKMLLLRPHPRVNSQKLLEAIVTTKVNSRPKVILNGKEVDAINTPARRQIILSRQRWAENSYNPKRRFVLVAHEYFGIMGLQDQNYQISFSLFQNPGLVVRQYLCHVHTFQDTKYLLEFNVYKDDFVTTMVKSVGVEPSYVPVESFATKTFDKNLKMGWLISVNLGMVVWQVELPGEDLSKTGYEFKGKIKSVESLNKAEYHRLDCSMKPFTAVNQ